MNISVKLHHVESLLPVCANCHNGAEPCRVRQPEAGSAVQGGGQALRRGAMKRQSLPLPHRSVKYRETSLALVGQGRNTSTATASLPDHQYD